MILAELQNKIKTNNLENFYVFCGDEITVQQIYIKQIARTRKLEVLYIDEFNDIYATLRSSSLLQKHKLFVIRDDKTILTNETVQKQLLNNELLVDDMLILLLTRIDKRTRAFKLFNDIIINFDKLSSETLKKYVKQEVNLTDNNALKLVELCENDYGRILLEIDKIKQFDEDANLVLCNLIADGTIYTPPRDAIFDLVNAILDRDSRLTYALLNDCKNINESNIAILSVLYDNVKQLLQVQSYEGNNLSNATGLTDWQIRNAKKHIYRYTDKELIEIMQLIQSIDTNIKLGNIAEDISIEILLAQIFKKEVWLWEQLEIFLRS